MIITVHKSNTPKQYIFKQAKQKVLIGRNPKSQSQCQAKNQDNDDNDNCQPVSSKVNRHEGDGKLKCKQKQEQIIVVDQPTASRTHLAVKLKNGTLRVMDLGSSNGTRINGNNIQANQWVQVDHRDAITLGDSKDKIVIKMIQKQQSSSSSSSPSRSRQKPKKSNFANLCRQLKISDSSLKMLKQMTSQKKSKEQKIKFLKLMGCKNVQSNWQQIQHNLRNQNKYTNNGKKANQQLQRQFDSGRSNFQKKGLGNT